jgi:uncharacterized protein
VAVFFHDTSAIIKRYVQETGTAWVQALTAPAAGHTHFLARAHSVRGYDAVLWLLVFWEGSFLSHMASNR